MKTFYITTAIPYVNAAPHIGFAMEAVQADALSRYHRMIGEEAYYLTGVDEHGVKLYETAKEAGEDTQKFADKYAEKFQALKTVLNLTNDGFIRTTSDYHKKGAQKLWKVLADKGDIYKGEYEGLYCAGCEAFVSEKDLVEGKCPNHDKPLKKLKEENYFFKLSKYSDAIKKAIQKDELKILPESRKNEMLNIIGKDGLHDVSFSRPKDILPWGIDVPGDSSQVMYVWGDALSNYITGIGYGEVSNDGEAEGADKGEGVAGDGELFEKFWPCDAHLIGKDILRFHAGIWIGMLMSAGLALPKAIYVHGFITAEGKKMSKSVGNVVDPIEYVDKYGTDALRYYLLREIPTGDDGDFSQRRFIELYNSELANSYGNLVNRVAMMVDRYLGGKIKGKEKNADMKADIGKFWEGYEKGMQNFNIKVALDSAVDLLNYGNKYVEEQKPWALAKVDTAALEAVLYNLLEIVRNVSLMLWPVIPEKAVEVLKMMGFDILCIADIGKTCGYRKCFGFLEDGGDVEKGEALFPRIE